LQREEVEEASEIEEIGDGGDASDEGIGSRVLGRLDVVVNLQ
jgi:hypothetical protein